jgi:hypothetical protein
MMTDDDVLLSIVDHYGALSKPSPSYASVENQSLREIECAS